ncbi:MAG TPA: alpha/beta hydrolase, partial [Burkholderiaceae bacterium]|nr:alpha/beta hydrolase [Burkholderiaceae bacterium]
DDPLGTYERVEQLAHDWDSQVVDLGCVGHLNPASGYGRWSRVEQLIDELCARSATTPIG